MKIYGASDDLVEFEGCSLERDEDKDGPYIGLVMEADDEIDCYDKKLSIEIGQVEAKEGQNAHGVRVVMVYASKDHDAGVWEARISPLDEDVGCPWPVRVAFGPPSRGYSAVVEIDAPVGTPIRAKKLKGESE
jgi:hypothetical protein